MLVGRISLACGLYTRQNPQAYHHNGAHDNPLHGHMHQVRRVSQPAYQNCESSSVNSERHKISLSRQRSGCRSFSSVQCAGGNGLSTAPECATIRAQRQRRIAPGNSLCGLDQSGFRQLALGQCYSSQVRKSGPGAPGVNPETQVLRLAALAQDDSSLLVQSFWERVKDCEPLQLLRPLHGTDAADTAEA